jgi:hypothetical protein
MNQNKRYRRHSVRLCVGKPHTTNKTAELQKMKNISIAAALSSALFALSAQGAPLELVKNGSFEADAQGFTSWKYTANLTGWKSESTFTQKFELRNNISGGAYDGNNFVELDTTQNSNLYQDVHGVGKATLSFWYMSRPGTSAGTNGLEVKFGDYSNNQWTSTQVDEGTLSFGVAGPDSYKTDKSQWKNFTTTVDFGVNGSTKRLEFYALGTSDSFGTSLDAVSIVQAVPEPEVYALMLTGLSMMVIVIRRKGIQA